MTQEEELKIGEVGQKKSSYGSEKKRVGEGNICNLNQWQRMITELDDLCYCILTLQYIQRHYVAGCLLVYLIMKSQSNFFSADCFTFQQVSLISRSNRVNTTHAHYSLMPTAIGLLNKINTAVPLSTTSSPSATHNGK